MSALLLLFFLILLFAGGKFSRMVGSKFLGGKRFVKVFVGYAIVLLITAVLSMVIPVKESFEGSELSQEDINERERLNERAYDLISSGNVDEAEGLTEKETWEFPLEERKLSIKVTDQQSAIPFVEKVDGLQGKVEVAHYTTFSYVDHVDVTDRFTSPKIRFENAEMKIYPAAPTYLKLAKFKLPLPFNQFSGEKEDDFGFGMTQGLEFLYIRVPAGTEINGDVNIVNEQ